MKRENFKKVSLITVTLLACAFFGYGIILAQQKDQQPDPLIGMRARAIAQIEEMERRKNLNPDELKILQDLKKNKAEIEKKINDLKIELGEQASPAAQALENMKKDIKAKELKLEAASKEAAQKEIKAKEFELKVADRADSVDLDRKSVV